MRPVTVTRQLSTAADADGIALAQQLAGAGNLDLTGAAFVTNGVANLGAQRKVALASTGNLSAVNFTITGTDDQGRVVVETMAGPNNNSVQSVMDYATVTQIAASAAVGTDVTAGTNGVGASLPIPMDVYLPFGSTISVDVTGTINYTVQVTNDNPFVSGSTPINWVSHPTAGLVGATTDQLGVTANAYRAARLLTNSGTGAAALTLTQQGLIV